jgi:hypothetical protein
MRLIIAEKPSYAKDLMKNGLISKNRDTDILCTMGFSLWQYKIDKLSFADIPFTNTPKKLTSRIGHFPRRFFYKGNGDAIILKSQNSTNADDNQTLDKIIKYINGNIAYYDEIIVFVNQGRSGLWAANQLIEMFPKESLKKINVVLHDYNFLGIDQNYLSHIADERSENPWETNKIVKKVCDQQHTKATFDYWWNANSTLVLSEICKWTGLKSNKIISKYELMLIVVMSMQEEPLTEQGVLSLMRKWEGTGKYQKTEKYISNLGSQMSIRTIFENTIDRGAISLAGNGEKYKITSNGMAFCARLHKKTFDRDLPFRLEKWIVGNDIDSCKKYIRTLFGRQLKFQRNQIQCSGIITEITEQLNYQHGIVPILMATELPSGQYGNKFRLIRANGSDKGVMIIILSAGLYRAELIYDGKSFVEHIDEFGESESGIVSVAEWVRKAAMLWESNSKKHDYILF